MSEGWALDDHQLLTLSIVWQKWHEQYSEIPIIEAVPVVIHGTDVTWCWSGMITVTR